MDVKQVLILNGALNMSPGKAAAQAAHAAIGAFERADRKIIAQWHESGVTKICLRAESEERLLACVTKAAEYRLPAFLVADAGRTEIAPGSLTALAIGPADSKLIDKITGNLPLY